MDLVSSTDLDRYVPSNAETLAVISLDEEPELYGGLLCYPGLRLFDHGTMICGKHTISKLTRRTFGGYDLGALANMKGIVCVVDLSRADARSFVRVDWSQLQYAIDHFQQLLDSIGNGKAGHSCIQEHGVLPNSVRRGPTKVAFDARSALHQQKGPFCSRFTARMLRKSLKNYTLNSDSLLRQKL